ncbi:MAG: inorganic phosphate transporter [Verrucomicrobiota bacterium]
MEIILAILFGLFLAFANGANDNFKGVATLFGSHTTSYRSALLWATVTTALGSVAALFLATGLLEAFKGKGLVPPNVAQMTSFGLSVGVAAATTVMLATRLGFPISTTHALIGALIGAGWFAADGNLAFNTLGSKFLLPLLLSPILAIAGTMLVYPIFRTLRRRSGIKRETCLCAGTQVVETIPEAPSHAHALAAVDTKQFPTLSVGDNLTCRDRYTGTVAGISAETALDRSHFLSAGLVSFARGLNDTPKIAALMLVGGTLSPAFAIASVAVLIAAGGLISARRVAETMSLRVTGLNQGQGFTANLITGALVIGASRFGLPVSTTHVSCGALFGIGTVTRQAKWKTIATILAAWLITLPTAAALAALAFHFLNQFA